MVDEPNREEPLNGGPDSTPPSFYVVGIGASAGGVVALREFFSHVEPNSEMAFVVIQHLSPQHESNLPALLQTQTVVPVTQVNEEVKVEPNRIYVIPPSKYLIMADGGIRLTERQIMRGSHTSIS